jgi:hypothetical protein
MDEPISLADARKQMEREYRSLAKHKGEGNNDALERCANRRKVAQLRREAWSVAN